MTAFLSLFKPGIAALAGSAALAWGLGFTVSMVRARDNDIDRRAYARGLADQKLAGEVAVREAQKALAKALADAAQRETAVRAEMESRLAQVRIQAARTARSDHVGLSPDLVRLRNESRAVRNAVLADHPG